MELRQAVNGVDFTGFGGKSERLGADVEKSDRLGEVEPRLDTVGSWTVDRNAVMVASQGAKWTPILGPSA